MLILTLTFGCASNDSGNCLNCRNVEKKEIAETFLENT